MTAAAHIRLFSALQWSERSDKRRKILSLLSYSEILVTKSTIKDKCECEDDIIVHKRHKRARDLTVKALVFCK